MDQCPWSSWDPATMSFCEERLCAWITEPSNTWSNLAFLATAIFIYRQNRQQQFSYGSLFIWASVILAAGSFMFHMSGTFFFEVFDLAGMFMISGLMVVLNWGRFRPTSTRTLYWAYFIICSLSLVAMLIWRPAGIPIFATHLTIALTLELLCHLRDDPIRYRYSIITIGTFVVSFIIWRLDIKKVFCDPENHFITGHAIWHFLNALAIFFLYRFYQENSHPRTHQQQNLSSKRSES